MIICPATEENIQEIITIANLTWHETYKEIISQEQIAYMLNLFYSESTMTQQMGNPKHHFWIIKDNEKILGYTHCIEEVNDAHSLKISKLYVLPNQQGKGIGKLLLMFVENACFGLGKNRLILNVNRNNPAKKFYLKMGFEIVEEIDIPLDIYWLNDYVMEKQIC
jgi:GNAT superfamily N-acetyltransferase